MSPVWFAVVALAGGLGAGCRFLLDGLIRSRITAKLPVATIVINVSGSFLLGLVVGFASGGLLPAPWRAVAGVGFLGGFTTFSAASFETVRLLQQRRIGAAVINGIGTLVAATAAAALGMMLGGWA